MENTPKTIDEKEFEEMRLAAEEYLSSFRPPPMEDLLLKSPLYQRFLLRSEDWQNITNFINSNPTLDVHCKGCERHSIFQIISERDNDPSTNKTWEIKLRCMRNVEHQIIFIFEIDKNALTKIGQYPSLADLQFPDLKKYQKVLGKQYSEFAKGVGLVSHGIGIGAFVYLRRIFENLIEEAHTAAKSDSGWDDEQYNKSRMGEKITLLKHHLPDFLVQNAALYSILSKGIHELGEDECLKYFDVVKVGIEMILNEKIEMQERQKKAGSAAKALAALQSKLS